MSGATRQKGSVAETNGEDHKDDVYTGEDHKDDVYMDENGLTADLTNEGNNSAVHQKDLEEGSPPRPPHIIKDGGFTAWSTTLGACVESAQ